MASRWIATAQRARAVTTTNNNTRLLHPYLFFFLSQSLSVLVFANKLCVYYTTNEEINEMKSLPKKTSLFSPSL